MKTHTHQSLPPQAEIKRSFSEELKRRIVEQIDNRLIGVSEVMRTYNVSRTSIYKWRAKYSPRYTAPVRQVVELESEALIAKQLRERIADLERALGRKQFEIDVLETVIECASDMMDIDIKKKFGTPSSLNTESSRPLEAQ
jgi:transposase-like protein